MKLFSTFAVLATFFSINSNAAEVIDSPKINGFVRSYTVGACNNWTMVRDANGMYAYGCFSYPQSVNVPDSFDVSRALDAALQKIEDLEARVRKLESSK